MRTLLARSWAWGVVLHWSLSASPAVDRYVNLSNPSPSAPYTNWATAAVNIAPALAAAAGGDTVWVTNGTYAQAAVLVASNAVTLRSVNGAAVTVVRGSGSQRCFLVQTSAVLVGFTITNGIMTGGSSNGGGVLATGAATLRDCVLANNSVSGAGGGAAFVGSGGLVERCVFLDNLATNSTGGGYHGVAGTTVRNCLFLRNAASGGGGLWLDHGGLAENCTLVSNRAGAIAGGFVVSHGGEFLNGLSWHNVAPVQPNFTLDSTGGVVRFSSTTPMPTGGSGNVTNPPLFAAAGDWRLSWYSPGINAGTNQSWMTGGVDLDGAPRLRAGMVDMGAYETPAIYHVSTNGSHTAPFNTWAKAATNIQSAADLAGSGEMVLVSNGIYAITSELVIHAGTSLRSVSGSAVTTVDAQNVDRCLLALDASRVDGFTLTRGLTSDNGGGALATESALLSNCRFTGNQARNGGGFQGSGGSVSNCQFDGNTATASGGGAQLDSNSMATACLFLTNQCAAAGAGVIARGNSAVLGCTFHSNNAAVGGGGIVLVQNASGRNCRIIGNTATWTGGGVFIQDAAVFENSTIAGNSADSSGGLYAIMSSEVRNTIVYFNSAATYPNAFINSIADFLCTVPAAGSHSVTNDPLFANAAAGDYRLSAASPCWNAGTNLSWMTGATDLDGYPRIIHGTSDIGAYELSLYHYASQTGSNAWPYLSLAAGATNIQDAIDASAAGDTVYVNPGVYRPAATLTVDAGRDVVLRAYDFSSPPVLDGQGLRRLLVATNSAPQIVGFDVRNGFAGDGAGGGAFLLGSGATVADSLFTSNRATTFGGAVCCVEGATFSNCAFRFNSAADGGAVQTRTMNPAVVTDLTGCRFSTNRATSSGGGAAVISGRVERCVFEDNTAGVRGGGLYLFCGEIRNSLFVRNRADDAAPLTGGGVWTWGSGSTYSRMENCTVASNSAPNGSGGGTTARILYNCVIYGNQAPADPNFLSGFFLEGARNNLVPAAGTGCLTNDPAFAGPADFRLTATSPCVNAGTNLAWSGTATDLDGVPRVVDSVVDIGAYERTPRHYVHIGGKAIWPYIVSTVGAHDIQAAVDAAAADDTVYIAAGTYTRGAEIAVTQRLAIVGSGGRDATFVAGSASNGCFSVTTHALLDGLTLTGGTAGLGGGLFLSGGGTARNVRVTGCTGTVGGGGVYFGPGGGLVDRSEMDNNRTLTFDGAGVYLVSGASLRNSLVRNNSAHQNGGGLFFDHGGLAENCTVVSNHASSTGGGANFYLGGEARNTILYFNTAGSSGPNYGGSGATMDHCCSSPSGGTGGVTGDPLFVSPAAANYRLLSGSPCIDSGTAGPPDDLDGLPRPLDGNRNGTAAWDIGAFEFVHLLADTDANGMPDGWELEHFGSPLSGADPAADPDGDGAPNGGEAAADTDPLNAASVFRIERFFDETEFYTVQFTSSVNRVYTLQGTADPADPGSWQVSGPPRKPGPGGLMSIKEENRGALRFDRVLVELPP